MYNETKYLLAGDKALLLEFGNSIEEKINHKVRSMMIAIKNKDIKGIVEMTPTYRSLMLHYDPIVLTYEKLIAKLKVIEQSLESIEIDLPKVVEIPVMYGDEYGPDIENVANHNKISIEEVIKIHSSRNYLIYMLGFTPGFPYLGGMDEKIATPRLMTPRTKITGGSVGIAGSQTGIYPIDSPGGWRIIGKTPLKLYDLSRKIPILLSSGDYVRFVPINEEEFKEIEIAVINTTYKHISYPVERRAHQHG